MSCGDVNRVLEERRKELKTKLRNKFWPDRIIDPSAATAGTMIRTLDDCTSDLDVGSGEDCIRKMVTRGLESAVGYHAECTGGDPDVSFDFVAEAVLKTKFPATRSVVGDRVYHLKSIHELSKVAINVVGTDLLSCLRQKRGVVKSQAEADEWAGIIARTGGYAMEL